MPQNMPPLSFNKQTLKVLDFYVHRKMEKWTLKDSRFKGEIQGGRTAEAGLKRLVYKGE